MKNIHLIQTDKPSRLSILNSGKLNFGAEFISSSNSKAQHIYITSDEEIKEGDWCIDKHNVVYKQETDKIFTEFTGAKKIILTTDFTLAPDVHKIPDEFLEWFVKNPSCEEVGVELKTKQLVRPYDVYNETVSYYKIIIPQEEPKQEYKYIGECKGNNDNGCFMDSSGHDCGCFTRISKEEPKFDDSIENSLSIMSIANDMFGKKEELKQELLPDFKITKNIFDFVTDLSDTNKDEPKQETLEEAAKEFAKLMGYKDEIIFALEENAFIEGVKWQAERMYSEEEVNKLFETLKQNSIDNVAIISNVDLFIKSWKREFKKK